MRLAIAVLASGCFYGGRFSYETEPFPGKRVELACLDIAVTLTEDETAKPPIVMYTFGNRCTHDAIVDLGAVRVVGHFADGRARDLTPYDPRHELKPLQIDGWWRSSEEISYVDESGETPTSVCVDVGSAEKVTAPITHWVCLGAVDGGAS
jgi:hypothetical protein